MQLELFPEVRVSNAEYGLKSVPPGAERLLAELVRRGLRETDLKAAAQLCLALDERRGESTRDQTRHEWTRGSRQSTRANPRRARARHRMATS
jgi:hypothetical protein